MKSTRDDNFIGSAVAEKTLIPRRLHGTLNSNILLLPIFVFSFFIYFSENVIRKRRCGMQEAVTDELPALRSH